MAFGALVVAALAGIATAMALTAALPIGFSLLDYNLAFLALGALAFSGRALLKRRRIVSWGMTYTGIVATITGFVMLFTRDLPLKEWVTWWHSVTSVAFLALFVAHWALNQKRLAGFARRLAARARAGAPAAGAWVAGLALGALTWTPQGRLAFTRDSYLLLSLWAIWAGIAFAWGSWLLFRFTPLRARLAQAELRTSARALVDTSLWLACWLALLTGFPLLYLAAPLEANGLKYVGKWWHTATSVAFLALVAIHLGFNARLLRAHARRIDRDLARTTPLAPAPAADGQER